MQCFQIRRCSRCGIDIFHSDFMPERDKVAFDASLCLTDWRKRKDAARKREQRKKHKVEADAILETLRKIADSVEALPNASSVMPESTVREERSILSDEAVDDRSVLSEELVRLSIEQLKPARCRVIENTHVANSSKKICPKSILAKLYKTLQQRMQCLITTTYSSSISDNKMHCRWYEETAYACMEADIQRVRFYRDSISSGLASGKRVMDIGCGPNAFLSILAIKHGGASHIDAVEARVGDIPSVRKALMTAVANLQADTATTSCTASCQYQVHIGHTCDLIQLKDAQFLNALYRTDVIVQELFDDFLSTEGVFTILSEIQETLLSMNRRLPRFIPARGCSYIVPVCMPKASQFAEEERVILSPGSKLIMLYNLSSACFLAEPQIFEDLCYEERLLSQTFLNDDGWPYCSRNLIFGMNRRGKMIGFAVFFRLYSGEHEMCTLVDDESMHWKIPIVLLPGSHSCQPISIEVGDTIVVDCMVMYRPHRPDYCFVVKAMSAELFQRNPHAAQVCDESVVIYFEELIFDKTKSCKWTGQLTTFDCS